jgi:hypothetical protein
MDPLDSPSRIEACIVNHETSPFAELALRSFAHMHRRPPADLTVSLTIVDNHSQDEGFGDLETAAAEIGVPIVRSRWPAREARCNTHGDVLRDFVLDHRETDMFCSSTPTSYSTNPARSGRWPRSCDRRRTSGPCRLETTGSRPKSVRGKA